VEKVKITYITAQAFPAPKASTVQVMQMCAAFASAGAAVKLVARRPGAQPLSAAALRRHYAAGADFAIEQRPLPRSPRAVDLFQLQAVWREWRSASRPAAAAWVCYARGRDVFAPFVALRLGATVAVEVHGRPVSRREAWLLRNIQAHRRGCLVALSEELRQVYVRELGCRADKMLVAPDGVDLQRFTPPLPQAEARAKPHSLLPMGCIT